jgi:hypothetical protein
MLTLFGKPQRYCDGISRRNFLKIGAVAAGGITLADLLRADAAGATRGAKARSVINIYLSGGPTHMDTFDLKPEAPKEFRGEFSPIATNAPGVEICELFQRLARVGDKIALVRSITGLRDEHAPDQSDSGWSEQSLRNLGGRPGVGAVMSKLFGPSTGAAPTFVSLTDFGRPGFLGAVHGPYRPDGEGRANLTLNGISVDRLEDRTRLLQGLDRIRRDIDHRGMMQAMDSFNQRAVSVITSAELAAALDLSKEDPRIADMYGYRQGGRYGENSRFLTARRLVEAGVRCVTFSWGGWDTHGDNFNSMRQQLPALDRGLATLIEDLDARGLLDETLIVMSGEFGRTPRINGGAGRDHWPRASFFFLAGGGLRTGQVIGSTTRLGEEPKDRPVHVHEVFATIYRQLGIDVNNTTLVDPNGRPQYLVDVRQPIHELI